MKLFLTLVAATLCLSFNTANAQVSITFSTSRDSATAGTELDINDGESGSLFVFVDNMDSSGENLTSVALDVTDATGMRQETDMPGTRDFFLLATDFIVENPDNERFVLFAGIPSTGSGTLNSEQDSTDPNSDFDPNLLVDDSNAAGNPGIENGVGPVLHAELQFTANGLGSHTLELAEGAQTIGLGNPFTGLTEPQSIFFGDATVNVITPDVVPEPSSLALVGSLFGAALLRRRRRN